ncbi:hypothetical protein PENTCL1PPCAC_14825, partial [Pristionchus entomophagus]
NRVYEVSDQLDNYLAPELKEIEQLDEEAKKSEYKNEIVWRNVGVQIGLHIGAASGLYFALTTASWKTNVWMVVMTLYAGNSVTAGAHRMWCHKAFKANFWVRLFLMIGTTLSIQNDVIEWARDHRVHHKWADSDADPHNINRGFFFSHVGWLMVRKHPKVKEMGAKVDMSDLEADPILAFQRKFYNLLVPLGVLFLTVVPVYFWNEDLFVSFFVSANLRLAIQLHGTWLINSAAHTYGYKPFDTKITAVDHFIYACLTNGEAWHNYHHTFPQDYRASEYMWRGNMSAVMIDFFAYMGWVWDRKRMSKEVSRVTSVSWFFCEICRIISESFAVPLIAPTMGLGYSTKRADENRIEPLVDPHNQTMKLDDGSRISQFVSDGVLLKRTYEDAATLYEGVRRGARVSMNGPMLGQRVKQENGSEPFVWSSYDEVITRSDNIAIGFRELGLPIGEDTFIGIYSKNRVEWIITELAAYAYSNAIVPIYDTLGNDACAFIINET